MSGYPGGLYEADYCHMEGHIYPEAGSADPVARAHVGEPPSKCVRCGEINYALRSFLAAEKRRQRRREAHAT